MSGWDCIDNLDLTSNLLLKIIYFSYYDIET